MNPDAIVRVRFYTTEEGGRSHDVRVSKTGYGCVVFVGGEGFECRILLGDITLELGRTYDLPVKFLRADLIRPFISVGTTVRLWEGKDIGSGEVYQLLDSRS